MEDTRSVRSAPLSVQRAFAGSRLEELILVRLYELILPVLRRKVGTDQDPHANNLPSELNTTARKIA
jgi:hypothetical protein